MKALQCRLYSEGYYSLHSEGFIIQPLFLQMNGSTHAGALSRSMGGVGRNLADALTRLGCEPLFISAIGQDSLAHDVIEANPQMVSYVHSIESIPLQKSLNCGFFKNLVKLSV